MSAINGSVLVLILAIIGFTISAIHAYLTEGQPTMYTDTDHQKNREAATRYGTEYAQRRPGLTDPLNGEYADDLTPTALIKALGIDPDTITDDDLADLCDYFEDAYLDADSGPACEVCGDTTTADEATETIDQHNVIMCPQCAEQEGTTP